jgi:hypothetical protein
MPPAAKIYLERAAQVKCTVFDQMALHKESNYNKISVFLYNLVFYLVNSVDFDGSFNIVPLSDKKDLKKQVIQKYSSTTV